MKLWWLWRKRERELEREIQHHLQMAATERSERGASRGEAQAAAKREFGNVDLVKEVTRDAWGWRWLRERVEDVRFGSRMLRKNPGFTAVAVLTLALGVGVNTTVFTAFDSLALKPLPVKDPASVVRLERWFSSGASGDIQYAFSYPEYLYYLDKNHGFSGLIAVSWPTQVLATPPAEPFADSGAARELLTLEGQLVSTNYFSVSGINTVIGRPFVEGAHQVPGANPVIVLSYPFWERQLNSDREVAGKILEINGTTFTIIGVAQHGFIGTGNPPQVPDFWAPLEMQSQLVPQSDWLREPSNRPLQILGRLASGTSLDQAQAEAGVLAQQFAEAHNELRDTIRLTLHRATYFGMTDELWFRAFAAGLMAVVGLVLLVASVNLANMLLARAAGRQKEMGTRLALGASRGRLVRQLLTESVLLAMLGGLAGLFFSLWATRLEWLGLTRLIHVLLGDGILVVPLAPDIRVFLFTFALSLITGILFGLWPALQSSRIPITDTLKSEGSTCGQPSSRSGLRSLLVGGQVAVSMVLLISAGLLLRALVRSETSNPGFETKTVFHLSLDLGSDPAKAAVAKQQVIARLQTLPEVADVALADRLPYAGTSSRPLLVEASHASAKGAPEQTLINYVSPSFFPALGIPVVRGRNFTPEEALKGLPVAMVSESTARHAWPGEDPIGKSLKLDLKFDHHWKGFEVVGVAKDVRFFNLSRVDPVYVYLPANAGQPNRLLFRAARSPQDTLAAVRTSLGTFDRALLPKLGFESLDSFMRTQEVLPQAAAVFIAILAVLAVALAAIGVYGVMAYVVTERTREVGIRLALGASSKDVLRLIVRQGMLPVTTGAACGLVVSSAISGVLRAVLTFPANPDLLFGVSAFDPAVYVALTGFLATVALVACALPARRAMRVDPVVALRCE